jgi:protease-4
MQFVKHAAAGRGMDPKIIAKLADGRVYTGQRAVALNLIDKLGNFEDAVELAGSKAGIKGKLIPVYPQQDKMSFIRELTQSLIKNIDITSTISDNFRYIIN